MSSRRTRGVRRRPRPAGRPAGATAERTREEILDAALDAFGAAGFEAMSVRELTRRLGVSHNLVHHHFGSKEDLWRAALDHGVAETVSELDDLLTRSVGRPEPRAVLRTGIEQAHALVTRRPAILRILVDEASRPGPRLDYVYERYLEPMLGTLGRFLSASGVAVAGRTDPSAAVLFLMSALTAPVAYAGLASKLELADGLVETLIDLALDGLMPDPSA